jgi:hypothetical protein
MSTSPYPGGLLNQGYDRQTPDALPPAQVAGSWAGIKDFFNACHGLGYTFWLHDHTETIMSMHLLGIAISR